MADPKGVLVDNLIEALRQLQRYMIFGFGSALFLLVLVTTEQSQSSTESTVKIPNELLPFPIPRTWAVAVVISAYLVPRQINWSTLLEF